MARLHLLLPGILLLLLVPGQMELQAQYIYTDLQDTILAYPPNIPGNLDCGTNYYYLDLDQDGSNDFYIELHYCEQWWSPTNPEVPYYDLVMHSCSDGNEIAGQEGVSSCSGTYIVPFPDGTVIDSTAEYSGQASFQHLGHWGPCCSYFYNESAGLKIVKEGGDYYGWLKMVSYCYENGHDSFIQLIECTINSQPGEAIIAGQIFGPSCLPEGITFTTQQQIDSFQVNYPNCTEVQGDLIITEDNISDLNGLNVLTSIGGLLEISNATALSSLGGLDNITFIGGGLSIYNGDALTNLAGLNNVNFIGGDITLQWNDSLRNISALENLTSIENSIFIYNNPELTSLDGLDDITSVGEHLAIYHNNSLSSLTALSQLTSVGGSLSVIWCDALGSLAGLDHLVSIGGNVNISWDVELSSLAGLGDLAFVEGSLKIFNNAAMNHLTGLESLTYVGDTVRLENNALLDLVALNNLSFIGDALVIQNNWGLNSLSGLGHFDADSLNKLYIFNNELLSECDVLSICEYLSVPNDAAIYNNAGGCDSEEEVINACKLEVAEYINLEDRLSVNIYPNPSTSVVTIEYPVSTSRPQLFIYNIDGQEILYSQLAGPGASIDISSLSSGMYFLKVVSDNVVRIEKFVKE